MGTVSDLMAPRPALLPIDSAPTRARRMLTDLIEREKSEQLGSA